MNNWKKEIKKKKIEKLFEYLAYVHNCVEVFCVCNQFNVFGENY